MISPTSIRVTGEGSGLGVIVAVSVSVGLLVGVKVRLGTVLGVVLGRGVSVRVGWMPLGDGEPGLAGEQAASRINRMTGGMRRGRFMKRFL
jgi:hypothetical protein